MTGRKKSVAWSVIVPEATAARVFERLEAARQALKLTQVEFVRRVNDHFGTAVMSPQQYTNWKNGERPSADQAVAICQAHRLNLEFLYRGDLSALPHHIHDDIAARLRTRRNT